MERDKITLTKEEFLNVLCLIWVFSGSEDLVIKIKNWAFNGGINFIDKEVKEDGNNEG